MMNLHRIQKQDEVVRIRFPRTYCRSYSEVARIMSERLSREIELGDTYQIVYDSKTKPFTILVKNISDVQPFLLHVSGDLSKDLGFQRSMTILETVEATHDADFIRSMDDIHTLNINCNLLKKTQVNTSFEIFLTMVMIQPSRSNFYIATPIVYRPIDPEVPIISQIKLEIVDREGTAVKFQGTVDCILSFQHQ